MPPEFRPWSTGRRIPFGAVHILVNNAGILFPTSVIDIDEDEWDRVIDVNLKGRLSLLEGCPPTYAGKRVGAASSTSHPPPARTSVPWAAHIYTAAKAGVLGFTRHLAGEVAPYNITVNAVCPGLIDTEMVRGTIDEERTRAYARSFPIPRLGRPEEVADLVAFLALRPGRLHYRRVRWTSTAGI